MLGLTTIVYKPDDEEMDLLRMLSEGYDQKEIADKLGIPHNTLRQRVTQLKLNLGADTIGQMTHLYGKLITEERKISYFCVYNARTCPYIKK